MKHRFQAKGHINVQEAYAFRSICRRAPARCRFVTLQDSMVNLCIEAKGRSSSPALNRVLVQTWAEVMFRGQVPRGLHTPTWSLRADEPSRNRPIRPPRMRFPNWLWLLLRNNTQAADAAVLELDQLPPVSRPEVRWINLVLGLATSAALILGRGRGRTEEGGSQLRGDSTSTGTRCDVAAARPSPTLVQGLVGDAGESGVDLGGARCAGVFGVDSGVWLRDLRGLVAARRPQGYAARHLGGSAVGEAHSNERLEGGGQVGGSRALHSPHSSPGESAASALQRLRGLGVVQSPHSYLDRLLGIAEAGRSLCAGEWRYPGGEAWIAAESAQPQKALGHGKAAVRTSGRRRRAPHLLGCPEVASAWRTALAGISDLTHEAAAGRAAGPCAFP